MMAPAMLRRLASFFHASSWPFGASARRFAALGMACVLWLFGGGAWAGSAPPSTGRFATLIALDGVVGPASADYLVRGLAGAARDGASVVVLRIDTPGGLDTSMRDIIRAILASPVPVISWVGPSGSRAASAGTYILYASHLAAMAPGTNVGAATPVSVGGMPMPGREPVVRRNDDPVASAPKDGKPAGAKPRPSGNPSESKALNDAVAYIRSLAALHGRDADWAESAVREAVSLSAAEAAERKVIDLVAESVPDLLAMAHGRSIRHGGGALTLDTQGLEVRTVEADWRNRLLGAITNPNLALILLMIGIYGLFFEFMNPGALYPGTIGAISLLVGLYALSALPLDYAGLGLLLLGVVLMAGEAFTPTFGVLGIGGVIAFVIGGTLLIDSDLPGFSLSVPLLAGVGLASLGLTVVAVRLALRTRRLRPASGPEALPGTAATVLEWSNGRGFVHAAGERWQAVGDESLQPGQTVRVKAVLGLVLTVGADIDAAMAAVQAALPADRRR